MTVPYQEFPPDLRRLTPRTTALSGDPGSSIEGINTFDLPDGAVCFAQDVGFDYRFRSESAAAPAGDDVLAPSAGPGRWLKIEGSAPALLLPTFETEISVNTSHGVAQDAWETLMSLPVTTTGGRVWIHFDVSVGDPGGTLPNLAMFRILVDGGVLANGGGSCLLTVAQMSQSVALSKRTAALVAGAHTVSVEWRSSSASGALRIAPSGFPDSEHASLYVQEVAA
jgi:hypothetical protein